MPLMNFQTFNREIQAVKNIYRQDNAWVGRFIPPSWDRDLAMTMYIRAAYRLYRATGQNQLRLVLLGGTEIRKARNLIMNFGITAANGIQERETAMLADAAQAEREEVNDADLPVNTRLPTRNVVPVCGLGSILSEDRWTPLLNDALIVGGATANHEFVITLEPYERGLWRECEATLGKELRELEQQFAQFGNVPAGFVRNTPEFKKLCWKKFISWNLRMFWDTRQNIPRVLARELIGLSIFGYKPVFGDRQLAFRRPLGARDPVFSDYVRGLRNLRFHVPGARARIMENLSEFLFDERDAFGFRADQPQIQGMPHVGNPIQAYV